MAARGTRENPMVPAADTEDPTVVHDREIREIDDMAQNGYSI